RHGLDHAVVEGREVGRPVDLQPREAGVAHDREQPGLRLPAQPVEEPVGAQRRLLHHVLRAVVGARDPAREGVRRIEVRQHQPLESLPGLVQGSSIISSQATTRIVPVMSSWKSPQKWSQANPNVPTLSGVSCKRVKAPGTMSVRSLKSGRLKPMTTSPLVNSSTTSSPFLSSMSLGTNSNFFAVMRITLSSANARKPNAPAAAASPNESRRRRRGFMLMPSRPEIP